MGKKIFKTIIKDVTNECVSERILGIMCGIAGIGSRFAFYKGEGQTVLLYIETTRARYRKIQKFLNKQYPNLCITFNAYNA